MSGKCYSCAASFGFFKKELGCKNCGFAFCKDCLSQKIAIPKHKNEVHKVCTRCFKLLSGEVEQTTNTAKYSPPEAYKKRVAALENQKGHKPSSHGGKSPKVSKSNRAKFKGMSEEDIAIAERLEKLKEERKKAVPSQKSIEERLSGLKEDRPEPPSSEDMRARLAKLKGQDPATVNKPHVFKQDTRAEQTQIDDLLNEISEEVEIDSHGLDPQRDVQQRLDHLRDKDQTTESTITPSTKPVPSVSKDYKPQSGEEIDINEMNKLMAQVAQELEIDARKAIGGLEKDKELMARLNKIKQERKSKQNENESGREATEGELEDKYGAFQEDYVDSEDEEETIKRILKKSLAEAAIDDQVAASGFEFSKKSQSKTGKSKDKPKKEKGKKKTPQPEPSKAEESSSDEYSESDEFPWCCICNEDATLKCIGCDYDLYCKRCYKEGHDKLDMQDHVSFPFSPRKKKKGKKSG